jgi:hypothetical protein
MTLPLGARQLGDPGRDTTYHEPVCDHAFAPPKCSALYHAQVGHFRVKWPDFPIYSIFP